MKGWDFKYKVTFFAFEKVDIKIIRSFERELKNVIFDWNECFRGLGKKNEPKLRTNQF